MSTVSSPRPSPSAVHGDPGASSGASGAPRLHRSGNVDLLTWRLAVANLVAQIAIIITGGLVRLTGSGLGCSTWPLCEPGQLAPVFHEAMTIHPLIEFGNRLMTGVLLLIAGALVLAVHKRPPVSRRAPGPKILVWTIIAGILIQAVVGGVSVWIDLHPLLVGFHMMLSLVLVAVSTVLLVRLAGPDGERRPVLDGALRALPYLVPGIALVMSYLGTLVTGTGPHSGDASQIVRLGFEHSEITRAHSLAVWVFVAVTIAGLVLVARDDRSAAGGSWHPLRRALTLQLILCLAVGATGYFQYATGLPVLAVAVHMLGAALVVAAAALTSSVSFARVPAPAGTSA